MNINLRGEYTFTIPVQGMFLNTKIEIKGQWYGPRDRYYDEDLLTILEPEELDLYLNQILERLTKMYQDMLIDVERFDEEDYLRNKEYVKKLAKQRETDKK